MDSNITLSALTRQMAFEGVKGPDTKPKKDKSKDEPTKNWSDAKWIHHPKVLFRQNIRTIDWGYWMSECDGNIDFDAVKNEEAEALAPSHPLPTPNQLKEIANGDEPTMIWIGKTSLNGVVKLSLIHI